MTRNELEKLLSLERDIYCSFMFPTVGRRVVSLLKKEPTRMIMRFQRNMRWCQYYYAKKAQSHNPYYKLMYLYRIMRHNRMQSRLGCDIGINVPEMVGEGLLIYHSQGIVINSDSKIGKNCHLHGNNCIGRNRPDEQACPVIGDNVMLGVGAKVLGDVTIADNIRVAAGAVVVSSFSEPGITIGGIPARKISG